jgi:hypothetical protein
MPYTPAHSRTRTDERPPWRWLDYPPTYDEWLDSLAPLDPDEENDPVDDEDER